MKFVKLFFSIFLMFGLLISSISPGVAFATDSVDYSGAVSRMKQLGVLDNSISDDTKIFTRGQFAKAIVVVDNLIDTASAMEGSTVFPDITANSEQSGYVNVLMNKQLITGMADGKFHAEAAVTYSEITTVLVKLLGYSESDLTGTWPSNFISKASNLRITSNLTFKKNDKVTIRNAALMFDRFLNTEIKSQNGNGSEKVTFLDSTNIYSDCIIYDNSDTASSLAENEVLTDKGVLYVTDSNTKLQVGATYRVRIENEEITKVYGITNGTESITVKNMIGNVVYYNKDSIEKSMTLPSSIDYYYHGTKEKYENLSSFIVTDMTIMFYSNNNSTNNYAVITDPVYSKPQLALNYDPKSNKIGDITFDSNTKIIKSGRAISTSDITERDVVYSVTDINGKNKYILVVENYVEGNITNFLTDVYSTNGIQLDSKSYYYSNSMNITKLSSFGKGDLVALILGYDGKIEDIKKIDNKTGSLLECLILGNSKTNDNLSDNEVLTDKGTFTYTDNLGSLDIGAKYELYISDNTITKIEKKENITDNYVVTEKYGLRMNIEDSSGLITNKELPKASVYYYHGEKIGYEDALASINNFSSIILSKSSNNKDYEYAVIIDPCFSAPQIFVGKGTELWSEIENSSYQYIYRNETYTTDLDDICENDVIYFVSDIWNRNCYIYAKHQAVSGTIKAFSPNKINATSITIDNQIYKFSPYFSKVKLNNCYTGKYVSLLIGVDGKVVDIEY
ncbi:surface layer protein precursor [Clostridium homopropionicum DSM 5847]|uniref:Surface layer protein n=1 Tax=Clostridium homopropionicum DSM 5847 TaxID=1121318 RepID=A0A0L6ZCB1_9CLOT|nr:S-layer homology domain-containing protein [Clostridium homopropionicum]KOA20601.1 surface layer protein precursor [Clostridium homopropionicum DSM 5847]SFF93434.1 hypothetical protein SAMN04488501_103261 [Clostridium homopropionicum]